MIQFPHISPIAISLGPIDIRWYALAYIAGFVGGLYYLKYQAKRWPAQGLDSAAIDSLFTYVVLGVILGGRIGYTLFYNAAYYLNNPSEILMVWQGGMSFHGGALGVIIAILIFARRHKIHPADIGDRIAPGICIGIFTGRLANFINGELWGKAADPSLPWAMVFPNAGPLARHPSQLYQALLEGLLLLIILHLITLKKPARWVVSGSFLVGYGIFRAAMEMFREPDRLDHLSGGIYAYVSQGQLLSIPMIVAGAAMIIWGIKHAGASANSA